MTSGSQFKDYLARTASEVNLALESLAPRETLTPVRLHQAMRYSLFAGGKRLRPILTIAAGEALGAPIATLLPVACAIEMIHTYSLIHDDLPAMDDDDLRRGRPTCHKAFDEATAILAGDALLTLAFNILARPVADLDSHRQLAVIREISSAAGTTDGLIGGQMEDLDHEGVPVDEATVRHIHRSKTGALIRASVVTGGLVAGGDDMAIRALGEYGNRVGLAFQIADDLLDVTSTREELGKTPGKDEAARKATFPALLGREASLEEAERLVAEAIDVIAELGPRASVLKEAAKFVIARKS